MIQSTSGLAFHEHSRLTAMVKAPSPPDAPMFSEFDVSVTAHCAVVGAVTLVDDEEPAVREDQKHRGSGGRSGERGEASHVSDRELPAPRQPALMSFDLDC